MRDYIEIGPAPCEEQCEQVGPDCDYDKMRKECGQFIELIRKELGPEPEGARLAIKRFGDAMPYYEVVCWYESEESFQYALKCEREAPTTWGDHVVTLRIRPFGDKKTDAQLEQWILEKFHDTSYGAVSIEE